MTVIVYMHGVTAPSDLRNVTRIEWTAVSLLIHSAEGQTGSVEGTWYRVRVIPQSQIFEVLISDTPAAP